LLALAFSALSVPAAAEFRFQPPEGFQDLSPGGPESRYEGLPANLVSEVKSGKYAAFAMEFREEDGFYENFNAVVQKGALRVDEAAVKEWGEKLPAEFSKAMGGPVTVVEVKLSSVGGVPVIRAIFDATLPEVRMRQMQYVVPGGNEYAILTYSSTPEVFDRYVQIFDAAAMATQGAEAARVVDFWRAGRYGLVGAAIALVAGLVQQLVQRSRSGRPSTPARSMPAARPTTAARPVRRVPPRPASRR
jgi:hypothetical protein